MKVSLLQKAVIVFFLVCGCASTKLSAQQIFPVTDSLPANLDGLKAGYSITEQSEKEVGNKGNFSRYKLKFFVTNTSSEAKIFLKKSGLLNNGSAAHDIVDFKCSNATGARFTNKSITLQMSTCMIEASVEDKECGTDKKVKNQRFVDVGYWIKAGESITANCIMIVPLNEKPSMAATFYPNNNGINGTISNQPNNNGNNNHYTQTFVHLKNFASNNYLNNQNGPVACTTIEYGWWSSQWELLPVNGTSNFQIKNRWKNNFISTDNSNLISDNGQSAKAMWAIEETNTSNIFYIKNVADNSKLIFQNGMVKTSSSYGNGGATAQWIIEK
jgi:hypothetical protein